MKFFIDTEFFEDGRTIDLISIGVVCENGQEFYRQNAGANLDRVSTWVRQNVVPQLAPCPVGITPSRHVLGQCSDPHCLWAPRRMIANSLKEWVTTQCQGHPSDPLGILPEFWGEDCAYDFVVVSWLFGGISGIPGWPAGWPYFFYDIDAAAHQLGHRLRANEAAHHALSDAWFIRDEWRLLMELELTSSRRTSNVTGWDNYARRKKARTVDQESEAVRSAEGKRHAEVAGGSDQQRQLQQVEEGGI